MDGKTELVVDRSLHGLSHDGVEYVIPLDSNDSTTNSLWIGECEFSLRLFPTSESIVSHNKVVSPFIILLAVSFSVLCLVVFYSLCCSYGSDNIRKEFDVEIASAAIEESVAKFVENSQEEKTLVDVGGIDAVIGTKPDIFLDTTVLVSTHPLKFMRIYGVHR
jgi:hypothetical protein